MPNNLISAELSQQLIRDDCKSFNIRKDDGWKEFVAIVRCKDCRYWSNNECIYCYFEDNPNGYCAWAKRREDDNTV